MAMLMNARRSRPLGLDTDWNALKREEERILQDIKRERQGIAPRPAGTRPAPPQRAAPPVALTRGYKSGEPWRVCLICHEPTHLAAGRLRCDACEAEVKWRVKLARSGLRVVA